MGGVLGRQHEGGFAEVELGGEALQVLFLDAGGIREDGERIAAEADSGEDVDGCETVDGHGQILTSAARPA